MELNPRVANHHLNIMGGKKSLILQAVIRLQSLLATSDLGKNAYLGFEFLRSWAAIGNLQSNNAASQTIAPSSHHRSAKLWP